MIAKKKEGCFIYQYHGTTKVTDSSLLELQEVNNPCTSFSKYLYIITILIYGPQRTRMF
jgi:hypothetical protein